MKIARYFIFITLLLTVFMPVGFARAQSNTSDGTYELGPMIYKFHLNFQNGKLTPVVKDVLPYDFISDQFVDKPGLYYGKIFSLKNQVLGDFHFDLTPGNNDVLAPYFGDAKTVAFYKSNTDSEPMLALSVSKTALCNDNKVCQTEQGEDATSCPTDCAAPGAVVNANTPAANTNSNVANNAVVKYYNILIIGFIILGVATMAVFVIMFIRRNRN